MGRTKCLVLLACVWLAGVGIAGNIPAAENDTDATARAKELSLAFRRAAGKARPSVVTVISKYDLKKLLEDAQSQDRVPRLRDMPPGDEELGPGDGSGEGGDLGPMNLGSGVITDASGLVLTNSHVVERAKEVVVRLQDGAELRAKDIRTDPMSDVAILRVESDKPLTAARLGDSDAMEIGDWVIAIGSPFELESTVSAGIISGKGRGIAKIRRGELLQTDAAINPGNSGGPLVNLDGDVVGINTAIATVNGGYQGVGFAIPIKRASWVAKELLDHGKVRRAYLGIQIGELTAEAARKLKVGARSGVWVVDVLADGPADKAGVKDDDVIVEFAGVTLQSPGKLQETVEEKEIGSEQQLTVIRDGKRVTLNVKLLELPENATSTSPARP